jgi:hypothetical protein
VLTDCKTRASSTSSMSTASLRRFNDGLAEHVADSMVNCTGAPAPLEEDITPFTGGSTTYHCSKRPDAHTSARLRCSTPQRLSSRQKGNKLLQARPPTLHGWEFPGHARCLRNFSTESDSIHPWYRFRYTTRSPAGRVSLRITK